MLPAIVTVPVRDVVNVFAATLTVVVPLPEPLAPAVTVIHVTLLTAVHEQPAAAVVVIVAVPPLDVIVVDVGEIVNVQGTPDCVTV